MMGESDLRGTGGEGIVGVGTKAHTIGFPIGLANGGSALHLRPKGIGRTCDEHRIGIGKSDGDHRRLEVLHLEGDRRGTLLIHHRLSLGIDHIPGSFRIGGVSTSAQTRKIL